MGNKTLEEVLEKAGLAARWRQNENARARQDEKTQIAQNLIKMGLTGEQIMGAVHT